MTKGVVDFNWLCKRLLCLLGSTSSIQSAVALPMEPSEPQKETQSGSDSGCFHERESPVRRSVCFVSFTICVIVASAQKRLYTQASCLCYCHQSLQLPSEPDRLFLVDESPDEYPEFRSLKPILIFFHCILLFQTFSDI